MSLAFKADLFVRIEQMDGPRAPRPLPLDNGFDVDTAYLVLGMYVPAESADAWLILANGRDEIWFISNRHVRVCAAVKLTEGQEQSIRVKH